MNFKSLFRVCVLAAMLLPIEAACSLSARPKGKPAADREYDPQTTASFFYTEGIKNNVMEGDTARSIRLFEKVLAIDSTHAPSLYEHSPSSTPEPARRKKPCNTACGPTGSTRAIFGTGDSSDGC